MKSTKNNRVKALESRNPNDIKLKERRRVEKLNNDNLESNNSTDKSKKRQH